MRVNLSGVEWEGVARRAAGILFLVLGLLLAAGLCTASTPAENPVPNIFEPHSTPADSIFHLSGFVLAITGTIFLVGFILLVYVVLKFRASRTYSPHEPPEVYGS